VGDEELRHVDDILRQPEVAAPSLAAPVGRRLGISCRGRPGNRRGAEGAVHRMGSSLFAAFPAAYYLERHGVAAECLDAAELLHFRHASLDPQTTVVLISRSGESVEALKLLPLLSGSGAKVVGVTNVETADWRGNAAEPFVPERQRPHGLSTELHVQRGCAATPGGEQLEARSRGHSFHGRKCASASRGPRKPLSEALMNGSSSSPRDGQLFPGARRGEGSAHEGALLLHEAARTPAAALSPAQFRHGPVEVTGAGTRAVIFPSQGPARELDLALAVDMERMGARVRLCDSQDDAGPFAPVIEIIPVQAGSCALALSQGLDPGDFRYASLVTASETGFRTIS